MARPQKDLTQSEILAWADGLAGVPMTETAGRLGVSEQSIRRWREKVKNWIAEEFNINEYRMPLYSLYPLMVNSLIHNLKKNDVTTTLNLLKGLQITVDKNAVENTGNLSNLSDDELRDRLRERIEVKRTG